jgi:NAD(P)-dependent dehydrogenase (short-subunit alcohol dehydrogenase family)
MADIALVTGGSRGIGAACAVLLAERGYDVAFSYLRRTDKAEEVADKIRGLGRKALMVRADIAVEADILRLFATVDDQWGPLGLLVNNVGITGGFSRLADVTSETVRRVVDTNLTGTILCCREAVRRMSTAYGGAGGVIINVSSGTAYTGSPSEYISYAATNGGINTLTVGLGREVIGEGVRVAAVAPGTTDTDIHAEGGQPDRPAIKAAVHPMGRVATAEEIAEAVVWLASDAASYVNAAVLPVTGA